MQSLDEFLDNHTGTPNAGQNSSGSKRKVEFIVDLEEGQHTSQNPQAASLNTDSKRKYSGTQQESWFSRQVDAWSRVFPFRLIWGPESDDLMNYLSDHGIDSMHNNSGDSSTSRKPKGGPIMSTFKYVWKKMNFVLGWLCLRFFDCCDLFIKLLGPCLVLLAFSLYAFIGYSVLFIAMPKFDWESWNYFGPYSFDVMIKNENVRGSLRGVVKPIPQEIIDAAERERAVEHSWFYVLFWAGAVSTNLIKIFFSEIVLLVIFQSIYCHWHTLDYS